MIASAWNGAEAGRQGCFARSAPDRSLLLKPCHAAARAGPRRGGWRANARSAAGATG
jgi:hypothetical protein